MIDLPNTRIALLRDQILAFLDGIGDASPAALRDLAQRIEQTAQDLRQQADRIETADRPASKAEETFVDAWTDGACSGNPGPGGWAVVLTDGRQTREIVGGADSTTNNAMELSAILAALEAVPAGARVRLHTDSQNAIGWLAQGWKRKDPKVAALCVQIDQTVLSKGLQVDYVKALAHQGDEMNNRADKLAAAEAQRRRTTATA
jgi:ribonuclease HI